MNPQSNVFRLFIACLLSMALHSVGIALFAENPDILNLSPFLRRTVPDRNITLEFIPAPENVPEKTPPTKTSIIAEKDTAAQNPLAKPSLPKGDPYQHGAVEYQSLQRVGIPTSQTSVQPKERPKPKIEVSPRSEERERSKAAPEGLYKPKELPKENEKQSPRATKEKPQPAKPSIKKEDLPSPAQKNPTTTAEILAEYSYNARSDAVARYFSKELKKISNVWHLELYSSQELSQGLVHAIKKTVVVFKIMPDGHVEDLQVIHHEGPELTLRYPILAVEKTEPFIPLPPDVLSYIRTDGLWIKIEFNYTSGERKT